MSRKTTTAAAAACLTGVLALSACGGGGFSGGNNAPQATAKGPVKLTVMIGSSGDAETNAVKAATEAWANKTGNTVEVIAASDLGQQLGQAFASTTPPDVFYTDASKVGTFAKAGNLFAYGDQVTVLRKDPRRWPQYAFSVGSLDPQSSGAAPATASGGRRSRMSAANPPMT